MTKNVGESLRAAGALSTVGLSFVLALGMGFWLGTAIDRWIGTKPLFTIACFFLGLAAGILNVYRIVSQAYPTTRSTALAGSVGSASPAEPGAARPASRERADPADRDLYDDGDR